VRVSSVTLSVDRDTATRSTRKLPHSDLASGKRIESG